MSLLKKLKKKEKSPSRRKIGVTEYFDKIILGGLEALNIKHPNDELWLNHQIKMLCKKASSTQLIPFLEKLDKATNDPFTRSLLAKKIYALQTGYSFQEALSSGYRA